MTAEGDHWRWQRKLASPLFRQAEILKYVPAIVAATSEQIARWRRTGSTLEPDLPEDMTELTFAIIARTVLAGINEKDAASVKVAGRAYLDKITWEIAATLISLPDWVWHPGKARMQRASREVRRAVQNLLDQRRASEGQGSASQGDDLVARMLSAVNPDTGAAMTDAQIVDNLATFLLAGHETTAKALAWTLYLLARAPDWQQRCRREVLEVTNGGAVEAQHLGALPTLTRVLKKSMRLYPPVPVMTRVAVADITLGETRLSKSDARRHSDLRRAPAQQPLGRPRPFRSRPLSPRTRSRLSEDAVHAVRLWSARLHRLGVCHDRGDRGSRDTAAKRVVFLGRTLESGACEPCHAAPQGQARGKNRVSSMRRRERGEPKVKLNGTSFVGN